MSGSSAYLEVISGDLAGREFNLVEGNTTIGRGKENVIQILDQQVSRAHALIRFEKGSYSIQDLGSTGGTRVNEEMVQTARLHDGDRISLGGTKLVFHQEQALESAPTVMGGEDVIPTMMEPSPVPPAPGEVRQGPVPIESPPAAASGRRVITEPPAVPPPPPPHGKAGTSGRPPERGAAGRFPLKWFGLGCAALLIIGICIGAAMFGANFIFLEESGREISTPSFIMMTATSLSEVSPAQNTEEPEAATPEVEQPEATAEPTLEAPPSPEGEIIGGGTGEIAFASDVNGVPQIFLRGTDGVEDRQLTNLPDGACQPAWARDGMRMVFTSPCSSNKEEYPGSTLFLITFDAQGAVVGPSPLPSVLGGGDFDPAWAFEGDQIAFTSLRTSRPQIFVMTVGGAGLKRLTEELTYNWQPAWAPAGDQIAFLTSRQGVDEIWFVPSTGGSGSRFTLGDSKSISNPDWSPDGSMILFDKVIGAIPRLVGAPVAEGGLREIQVCQEGQLAVQPMADPDWSPDGGWVAFETWPDGVNHNIAFMNTNCTGYQDLTSGESIEFDPAWRPAP